MEATIENSLLGLAPEVAQGLSLFFFVVAALLFMLIIFVAMKRRRTGQKSLPSAAVALLMIAVASFVGALILKIF